MATVVSNAETNAMSSAVEVRRLIYRSLVGRGVPASDADDAAQDAVVRILRSDKYAEKLGDLENNRGYFIQMGYTCWLGRLRQEKSRRVREGRYVRETDDGAPEDPQHRLFDLAKRAKLTPTQVEYLRLRTDGELSNAEIALQKGVSPRSVARVLERARDEIRRAVAPE
jgi:DNA-directed RNA polymerase specialized sigma24 family protein